MTMHAMAHALMLGFQDLRAWHDAMGLSVRHLDFSELAHINHPFLMTPVQMCMCEFLNIPPFELHFASP